MSPKKDPVRDYAWSLDFFDLTNSSRENGVKDEKKKNFPITVFTNLDLL